jgi:hypothetical protein
MSGILSGVIVTKMTTPDTAETQSAVIADHSALDAELERLLALIVTDRQTIIDSESLAIAQRNQLEAAVQESIALSAQIADSQAIVSEALDR